MDIIKNSLDAFLESNLLTIQPNSKIITYGFSANISPMQAADKTIFVQPWRNPFLALEAQKLAVFPNLESTDSTSYDLAILNIDKNRALNEQIIFKLCALLKDDGQLLIVGSNKSGVKSIYSWLSKHIAINGRFNKHHCLLFWLQKPQAVAIDKLLKGQKISPLAGHDFQAPAGSFSWQKIDQGSALLAQYLDSEIQGKVADFGAGWGYLSYIALQKSSKIQQLDLYEAYWPALQAAKFNLAKLEHLAKLNYQWLDIGNEPITEKYDTIICNPPFHSGHQQDIDLGQAFIKKAATCLKRNGQFLMVANNHLPYEAILKQCFKTVTLLTSQDGFKVIKSNL